MPHYKDGTPAKLGDVVKGQGYNIKHEIIGVVMHVQASTEQCNISIAHAVPALEHETGVIYQKPFYNQHGEIAGIGRAKIDIEYGQTDAFEKIA